MGAHTVKTALMEDCECDNCRNEKIYEGDDPAKEKNT